MITIHIFKTNPLIELIKTDLPNTYVNFYVNGNFNSELSFTFYQQIHLNRILNAKSISVEYVKEKIGQISC